MPPRLRNSLFWSLALVALVGLLSLGLYSAGLRLAWLTPLPEHPALLASECWFQHDPGLPKIECFYVQVPENHAKPDGRQIRFAAVRLQPLFSYGRPVVHLGGGGPGNPVGIGPASDFAALWGNYRYLALERHRTFYIIDPRGVGQSQPRLICNEFMHTTERDWQQNLTSAQERAHILASMRECKTRLSEAGIDLQHYHSTAIAQDLEWMRQALDIPQWDLYAVSYATRYAQTLARDYPDSIGAMVLDGAVFPGLRYVDKMADDYRAAFQRAFAHCAREPACARQHPQLESVTWAVIEQLNNMPLRTQADHPYTGQPLNLVLTGDRLAQILYNAFYLESFYADFPAVIYALQRGDTQLLKTSLTAYLTYLFDPDYGDASQISHFCYEEYPFIDYKKAYASAKSQEPLSALWRADLELIWEECVTWDIEPGPELEGQTWPLATPTLFLHGALDPVLPVDDLDRQVRYFSQRDVLIFPGIAHDVVGGSLEAEKAAGAFFDDRLDYRKKSARNLLLPDSMPSQ